MTVELTPEAWAQVRYEYEHTDKPVDDICARARHLSSSTLRDRMRRWRWTRRRPADPGRRPAAASLPAEPRAAAFVGAPTRGASAPTRAVSASCRTQTVSGRAAARAATPHRSEDGAGTTRREIVPRLQGAVARVLPAIEATVGKLAAGPMPPREMERAARTLTSLTRTLRELHELLRQYPAPSGDRGPEDPDEFALELMRRLDAFKAAHGLQTDADDQHQGSSSAQPEA